MPDVRQLVYRQLVVLMALLAVAGAALSSLAAPFFFVAIAILTGAALGLLCRSWKAAIILGSIPLLFWSYANVRQVKPHVDSSCVFVRGVVEEPPAESANCSQIVVSSSTGRYLIRFSGKFNLHVGDSIEAKVLLDRPQSCQPWDFNRTTYLRKYGAQQSGWLANDLRVVNSEHSWWDQLKESVENSRKNLVATHRKYLGDTEGALLTSMVIGDRAVNLPNELTRQFRDVGLSHVLAASGFNLTIVTGCTLFLVRLAVNSTWLGNIACFATMLSFVVMAGPSPSVLRSALMLCVLLLYRSCCRQASMPIALSVAIVAAIVLDPMCIADVGFQLSYIATTAIICGVEPLRRALFQTRNYFGIAEAVSVIIIAQMGVLPLQLYYFWCLGLFFLPANLLVAPLVHLVTLCGFASSLLVLVNQLVGWLGGVIWIMDKIIWFPLTAILICVKYMASFEQAKLVLGAPSISCLIFYYFAFGLFLCTLKIGRWRIQSTCMVILAIGLLGWHPASSSVVIVLFKNAVAVLEPDHNAHVLGDTELPSLKRFLLYHGCRIFCADKGESIFIPQGKTTVVRIDEHNVGEAKFTDEGIDSLIVCLKGARFSYLVNGLLANEQFGRCLERCKTVWLVLDRGISKKAELAMARKLPSCVKIAKRAGESLVFEALNGSIQIRN
ncbi:MAG: ComEC/Rec2 family competence protein [Candidatus Obscuribacterales bacterium]|nr:ComEC/Rec2 family competence protein [Candidatus Obscuribacterales bacterium]